MSVIDVQERTISVGPMAISQESFECIVDTIGYSIGYWASSADWDDDRRSVRIIENDEGESAVHILTYEKIHDTFWKIVNPTTPLQMSRVIHNYFVQSVLDGATEGKGDIDAGHIDGDAADVLVQIAVFGKIVYG